MEILVLGLPRTGTQSIADALELLGYKGIYHMREVGVNNHQQFWVSALEAKYEGKGKPFGREEFDSLLHNYCVISDFPASIFPAEFIKAYPNAKIILTTRPEDAWYESMMRTIYRSWVDAAAPRTSLRPLSDKYHQHLWDGNFPEHGREYFQEHNKLVRELSEGRPFLEYEAKQGWEPLCVFLEKEIPAVDYPRSDAWKTYKAAQTKS